MGKSKTELPTMRQIRYLTALELLEGNEEQMKQVARECDADQGATGLFFQSCRDKGILTEDYRLTESGATWLHHIQDLMEDLDKFLQKAGLSGVELEEARRAMMENVDPDVLRKILSKYQPVNDEPEFDEPAKMKE